MKIHVLDHETYVNEKGETFITHSRPSIPPQNSIKL